MNVHKVVEQQEVRVLSEKLVHYTTIGEAFNVASDGEWAEIVEKKDNDRDYCDVQSYSSEENCFGVFFVKTIHVERRWQLAMKLAKF